MWNLLEKSERGHAQVSGIRKDRGWLLSRLTTPPHGRAFFCAHNSGGDDVAIKQATAPSDPENLLLPPTLPGGLLLQIL